MELKFNDGEQFNTDGKLRISKRYDGFYIVGEGMLIPANDRKEAKEILKEMKRELKLYRK